MKTTLITNASVVRDDSVVREALLIGGGKILACPYRGTPPEDAQMYDARGGYVLPAFIELHAHGGGGADFVDCTRESFDTVMQTHLRRGVTLLCPTLAACGWDRVEEFLRLAAEHSSPMMAGVHLEGPFLSLEMSGAQNRGCIIHPTARHADVLCGYASLLSCITAAPEEEGVLALAERMTACGVAMSVGHSNADADMFRRAAEAGFSRVTHLYSSTSRRTKYGSYVVGGIEEAALLDDRFTVELIGDGHHVCRESFLLTQKCKGTDGVCLVSDAMRAAGYTEDGESWLGEIKPENRVILEDGVAKLPDRSSFAGSLVTGDMMVQALCGRYGLPLPMISRMMSAVPARLLGIADRRGTIAEGLAAELVVLDPQYRTQAVFSCGEIIYEV